MRLRTCGEGRGGGTCGEAAMTLSRRPDSSRGLGRVAVTTLLYHMVDQAVLGVAGWLEQKSVVAAIQCIPTRAWDKTSQVLLIAPTF